MRPTHTPHFSRAPPRTLTDFGGSPAAKNCPISSPSTAAATLAMVYTGVVVEGVERGGEVVVVELDGEEGEGEGGGA